MKVGDRVRTIDGHEMTTEGYIQRLRETVEELASLFSEKCEECDGLRQTVADYQDEVAVLKSGAMVPLPETTPDRAVISPHTRGKPKRCPNCGHVAYRCKCLDLARADFSQADDTPTEGEGQSGASGGDSEGKEVIVRFDGNDEGSGILPTMAGAVDLTASGDDERPQAHPSEGLVSHNPHYPIPECETAPISEEVVTEPHIAETMAQVDKEE